MSLRSVVLGAALAVLVAAPVGAQSAPPVSGDFFEARIRPVLSSKCYACHSSKLAAPKGEAGGGVKGGMTYGATDEFGFKAVENRVSIHDLHATILNRLGIDHEKLTYRYAGRDFRLTDVFGNVVKDILL